MQVYISRVIIYLVFAAVFMVSQAACFRIYRPELRQGNYITQAKIDRLRVGLSKVEVQDIMGSPALVPAVDLSRWDYYYSYLSGDRKYREESLLSLYFVQDKLKYYSGDWKPMHLPCKPETT